MRDFIRRAGVLAMTTLAFVSSAEAAETIVFVRHGEKPDAGLGQLSCRGLNRSLALPAVIKAKFRTPPAAIFAPDPAARKDDGGKSYDYIRPLATVEPTAIQLGLTVDTSLGFAETDKLQAALEQPTLHDVTVLVAWEHKIIDVLAKKMVAAHGGDGDAVPNWDKADFDGIYIVTIPWDGGKASFRKDNEGLNGLATTCPN